MSNEWLNSLLCTVAHMHATGDGGGAALLMSETAVLYLLPGACLSPSSSSLPLTAALSLGDEVFKQCVTKGNFTGRGVWRSGVCKRRDPDLGGEAGAGSFMGDCCGFLPTSIH